MQTFYQKMKTEMAHVQGTQGFDKLIVSSSNLALIFTICFCSGMLGGTVSTLMSVYLPVAVRDLLGAVTDERLNQVSAYINSLFLFGWMFGGIIWGFACDSIGRSKAIILSTAFYGLFTVLTALSPSWFWVSVCRFFTGFGVGGVLVTTVILLSEIWPEKKRDIAIGILSIAFPVGIFSAGLINYLLPEWRQAFLIGIIPLIIAAASIWLLPESGKWKHSRQVDIKRKEIFQTLLIPLNRKNIILGSIIFGSMLIGLWAIFAWLPTWIQSLFTNTDANHERGLSMMLLGAGGLTGGFISGWFAKALGGLRKTMLVCFAGCFVLAFLLFKTNNSFSAIIYTEIAVLALFFGISQGILSAYIPQLFAIRIRAAATGFCFNIGRLFTATVVFFIGTLVAFAGNYGNAIFLFSFVFLIGFAALIFSREKKIADQ